MYNKVKLCIAYSRISLYSTTKTCKGVTWARFTEVDIRQSPGKKCLCPRDLTGEFIEGAFYREVWQFKAPGAGILILKEQRVLLQAAQMLKGQREGSVSRAWPQLNPGEGELYLKAPAKQGGGRRNKYPQLSLLPPSSLLSWPPIAQT